MEGHECGRGYLPIYIAKEWSDIHNQYGDPIGWTIIGVESDGIVVSTRFHEWKIELVIKQESIGAEDRSATPHCGRTVAQSAKHLGVLSKTVRAVYLFIVDEPKG